MKSLRSMMKDTAKATAKATKCKHASHSPSIHHRLRPPKKQRPNVETSNDEQENTHTDDLTQSSSDEFIDLQCVDSNDPNNDETSDRQNDDGIALPEMPGPSTLPASHNIVKRAKYAKDIHHFFEKGDKKLGMQTQCITCWCVSDD